MTLKENEKKALAELKDRLAALYGPRVRQTILYGSKARGDATDESDIDVLVVLDGLENFREARDQILHETTPIDLRYAVFLSVFAVDSEYFQKASEVPYYANVKAEGISL